MGESIQAVCGRRSDLASSSIDASDQEETGARGLIGAADVAAITGMSVPWVRKETRRGRIPHVPLGRRVWYRRESIDRWLQEIECGG